MRRVETRGDGNATSGDPIFVGAGFAVHAAVDETGVRRLAWQGRTPWQPVASDPAGMAGLFVPLSQVGEAWLSDPAFRPLHRRIGFPCDDVQTALALCGRLCHLIADLHDLGNVFCRLDGATVWADETLDMLRLLPLEPLGEHARVTATMRTAIMREQHRDCRHPAMEAGRAALAERRFDLHALGVLCCQILTGLPQPPSSMGFGAGPPAIAMDIAGRLIRDEAPRYETARGAALDFLECAAALRRGVAQPDFALGRQDGAPRLRMPVEVVGRDVELASLRERYIDARDRATCVYLSGAPGAGKTRMVEALRETVEAHGGCFAGGKFDQLRSDAPLTAVSEMLDQIARFILERPERLRAAWAERLRVQLDSDAAVIQALAPRFEQLFGPLPPPPPLPPLEARNRFTFANLRLVRAVARPSHPLCLFLDDMQWTDLATLELIKAVNADPTLRGVFMIGAYRDGEVDAQHPLALTIEQQKLGNYPPAIVALSALEPDEVASFVATILRRDKEAVAPLAAAINAVAGGNPFFIGQLVRSLVTGGVVAYDFRQARWDWNELDVAALDFDADVVALVIARLASLSTPCRRLLVHAAMLGRNVSLRTLQRATVLEDDAVRQALDEAVAQGVLVPRIATGARGDADDESYAFTHDRLQQAALELLPADETTEIRLTTGLALIGTGENGLDPALVALALSHVNGAHDRITDPETRLRLARLNAEQGARAHDRLAFVNALENFEAGLAWLPGDAWENHRTLTMQLHTGCFREACQTGDTHRAEALYETLMARVDGPVEAADIIGIRVLVDTAAKRYEDVWRHTRTALRLLGERLPAKATPLGLMREYLGMRALMRGKRAETLATLPETTSERNRHAIEVLASSLPALYFIDPQLMMLCGLRLTSMSIRKGTAPHSAIGFVIVGLGLASALERFEEGHAWGRVAKAMGDDSGNDGVRAKTRLIFGAFLNMWRDSIASSHRLLEGAYEAAMRAGDHQYALYTINARAMSAFFEGRPLQAQLSELRRSLPFVLQTQDPFPIESMAVWTGAIEQLIEGRASSDDRAARTMMLESLGNPTALGYHLCIEAQLNLMFGDPAQALIAAESALAQRMSLLGQLVLVEAEFAAGMAAAQLLHRKRSRRLRGVLTRSVKRLRTRAANAPANFSHHMALLEAEIEGLSRRPESALARYEAVADAAATDGFLNIAGLAARRAAEMAAQLRLSPRIIEAYRADADGHCRAWGATALLNERAASVESAVEAKSVAVLQADPGAVAHALGRHDDGEPRLLGLLRASLDETGTDAGYFVTLDDDAPRVLLACDKDNGPRVVPGGRSLAHYPGIIPEIVDLMRADRRERVIENLGEDTRFHVSAAQTAPVSVLCVPAMTDATAAGALYLTARTVRTFDDESRRAVRLAATEIATGLARLEMGRALGANERALDQATRRIETLTQARAKLATFLPQGLGVDEGGLGAATEQRVTAVFIDIQDYTVLVERHGAALLDRLIERRFSRFYDEISRRGGDFATTIGDAILAVFGDGPDEAPQTARAIDAALAVAAAAQLAAETAPADEPAIIVNIGIETGTAIARVAEFGAGDTKRRAFSVVGASVNVASRIVGLARNGEILIGAAARAALPPGFPATPRGAVRLKNVAEPVDVYEVGPAVVAAPIDIAQSAG